MSLRQEWFEKSGERKILRDQNGVTLKAAITALECRHGSLHPVAEEMAEWLYTHWSLEQFMQLHEECRMFMQEYITAHKSYPGVRGEREQRRSAHRHANSVRGLAIFGVGSRRVSLEKLSELYPNVTFSGDILLSSGVSIGEGSIIGSGLSLAPDVQIGSHCTVGASVCLGFGVRLGDGCVIGDRCEIDNNSQIGASARIGMQCSIENDVVIESGVLIGDKVRIERGCRIGKGVSLDEDCFIGQQSNIAARVKVGADTSIRAWNYIKAQVIIGNFVEMGIGCSIGEKVTIGDNTMLGSYCTVVQGASITPVAWIADNATIGQHHGVRLSGAVPLLNFSWHDDEKQGLMFYFSSLAADLHSFTPAQARQIVTLKYGNKHPLHQAMDMAQEHYDYLQIHGIHAEVIDPLDMM